MKQKTAYGLLRSLVGSEMCIRDRSCTTFPGLGDHYIRVSIGDDRENALFMEAIRDL